MWLPDRLLTDAREGGVRVFHVSYAATRVWAAERPKGEPLVFSGWYWARGREECGPFRSQSAAWRDAWYRAIRKQTPPDVGRRNDTYESEQQIALNRAAVARKRRRAHGLGAAAH